MRGNFSYTNWPPFWRLFCFYFANYEIICKTCCFFFLPLYHKFTYILGFIMHFVIGLLQNLTGDKEFQDKKTGVIKVSFDAQVVSMFRTKMEIENVKIPSQFRNDLEAFIGKNVVFALAKWNSKTDVSSGYSHFDYTNPLPILLSDHFKQLFPQLFSIKSESKSEPKL